MQVSNYLEKSDLQMRKENTINMFVGPCGRTWSVLMSNSECKNKTGVFAQGTFNGVIILHKLWAKRKTVSCDTGLNIDRGVKNCITAAQFFTHPSFLLSWKNLE